MGSLLCTARRFRSRERPGFSPSLESVTSVARQRAPSPAAARLGYLRSVLAVMLLGVGLASVATANPREGPAARQSLSFEERIDVEVFNVDVIVTDKAGRNVPGLGVEQFLLLVDGKPHEIVNFDARFRQREEAAAGPPTQEQHGDSAALSEHAGEVTWVVYMDLTRVRHSQRRLVQRQLHDFLNGAIESTDRTLVVEFDGVGPRIVSSLGTDKGAALKAMKRVTSNQPRAPFASVDLLDSAEAGLAEEDRFRRLEAAVAAADATVTLAGLLEGRVAVLFVAGGFNFGQITDDLRRARLLTSYQRMLDRLGEGPATVYTIFAGDERFSGLGADHFSEQEPNVASQDLDSYGAIATSSEVRAFAEESGGVAFMAATGLASRLVRLREDLDGYYSIGFHPTNRHRGTRHRVEVRLARSDLRVRHRTAHRVSTELEQARDAGLRALLAPGATDNPWGVSSRVVTRKRMKGGRYRVTVELLVPVAAITSSYQDGRQHGDVAFHFSVRGPEGWFRVVDSKHLTMDLSWENRDRLVRGGLRYQIDLIVSGGETSIAATVVDLPTGAYSTVVQPIVVPHVRARIGPVGPSHAGDPLP